MTTCFLFIEKIDDEKILSLRLDQNGLVDMPLAYRSIEETRSLQFNTRTIVVLPTTSSSLYEIELPWLAENKARMAIPFALEEQLAQNVSTLHFSFDRKFYKNNRYLIVVTDKQLLVDLISKLDGLSLNFDLITIDWFALNPHEVFVTNGGLLVNDLLFKGALIGELATNYLNSYENKKAICIFKDSLSSLRVKGATKIDDQFLTYSATRLYKSNLINLCQGELKHNVSKSSIKKWLFATAAIAGILFFSVVFFNLLYLHKLNSNSEILDKKIALIYHEFFPDAKMVISPKFRIEQLLKANKNEDSPLWYLLDKFAQVFNEKEFKLEELRYQSSILSIKLRANNFTVLENLEQQLKRSQIKVSQVQASSHDHDLIATLELSL